MPSVRGADAQTATSERSHKDCPGELPIVLLKRKETQEREELLARPALRQKFAAVDDIVLLKAVNTFRPWTAAVGTSKGIMKVFDDIAIHCRLEQSFGLKKPGTAMRTRFTNLVNQYKADQCQSMRKSGTTEEYAEREVLLQNIVTLMNDWEDKEAQRKEE
ncbi:hypothetical protein PInf_029362 [Phytophthora infestans]|nr:hypothetical protein PInf_029362 [Phytophthora infestans]